MDLFRYQNPYDDYYSTGNMLKPQLKSHMLKLIQKLYLYPSIVETPEFSLYIQKMREFDAFTHNWNDEDICFIILLGFIVQSGVSSFYAGLKDIIKIWLMICFCYA